MSTLRTRDELDTFVPLSVAADRVINSLSKRVAWSGGDGTRVRESSVSAALPRFRGNKREQSLVMDVCHGYSNAFCEYFHNCEC